MKNSLLTRRNYLTGIGATSLLATAGCLSPYSYGELDNLARTIADDLTEHTPYEYRADGNGNEDPGNEVYVGWSEGMLNVSVDAEFAESDFCREEYANKELQQDPDRMENAKNEAFETLVAENPPLEAVYFYALRDTMRDLAPKENTTYYAFVVDFQNGSIWNEYSTQKAQQLNQSLANAKTPQRTAAEQFRNHGRFECGAPENMPRPPE